MARSDTTVTDTDDYHIEFTEGDEESSLLVETGGVTITVEGATEQVRQRFLAYQAHALDTTVDDIASIDAEYPFPNPDSLETVPADERS